jgi:hypothetical protein
MMGPLPLGRILATPGALQLLRDAAEDPFGYLARHASGDSGANWTPTTAARTGGPSSTGGGCSAPTP